MIVPRHWFPFKASSSSRYAASLGFMTESTVDGDNFFDDEDNKLRDETPEESHDEPTSEG